MESYRDGVLTSTKKYKTAWVELGEILTKVATEKLYIDWGFSSFEEYITTELKLKKSTAIRLTNAFFFIEKEAPELKEKEFDMDVVSALAKVKKDDECPPEFFSDMLDLADKGRSSQTINKKHKEYFQKTGDKTKEFFKENAKLAKRLLQRIKPVGTIQDRYKNTLGEMVSSFDAESQVDED